MLLYITMFTKGTEAGLSLPEQDRLVVVGAGGFAGSNVYVPNLVQAGVPIEQLVLVDSDEQRLLAVQERVEGAEVSLDLDMALRELSEQGYRPGAIIIASPTAAHPDNIRSVFEAADAGQVDAGQTTIWCEKPVAPPETFLEIKALSDEHPDLDIYVGYVLRFSETLTALQNYMSANDLRITGLDWIYGRNRAGDPRPTQGVLPDKIVHPLSVTDLLLTRVLGESPDVDVESASIQHRDCSMPMAQAMARALNPAIPKRPSSDIDTIMHYSSSQNGTSETIPVSISSSYLFEEEIRRVNIEVEGPGGTNLLVIDFDVHETGVGGVKQRVDMLRTSDGEVIYKSNSNKSAAQIAQLLKLISRGTDPSDLLTTLEGEARIQEILRKVGSFSLN